jgi:hypothetical protein
MESEYYQNRQILKEGNIIKSLKGHSLLMHKIRGKTRMDTHIDTTSIEDYNSIGKNV